MVEKPKTKTVLVTDYPLEKAYIYATDTMQYLWNKIKANGENPLLFYSTLHAMLAQMEMFGLDLDTVNMDQIRRMEIDMLAMLAEYREKVGGGNGK